MGYIRRSEYSSLHILLIRPLLNIQVSYLGLRTHADRTVLGA
jgi:hypothetical protein